MQYTEQELARIVNERDEEELSKKASIVVNIIFRQLLA